MESTPEQNIERLRVAELEAKERYREAMRHTDVPAMRHAADHWITAWDALNDCITKSGRLSRGIS
ncbi:MAG TPA: hypothetical protein VK700_10835 [Steroidobacteraceae bacterium]|nr:hypothetical protein [Steroidobacteraceae bacterium]